MNFGDGFKNESIIIFWILGLVDEGEVDPVLSHTYSKQWMINFYPKLFCIRDVGDEVW